LRTPHGKVVKLPNEALAHAVAVEWNQQGDDMKTNMMPLVNIPSSYQFVELVAS